MEKDKDRILVRLSRDLSGQVRKEAEKETRSINSFIVNAVRAYLAWKYKKSE